MSIMQIYLRPVALDRNVHQNLRISSISDFNFARSCHSAIIATVEMNQAIKEFPVVFIKESDNYLPTAIFGLNPNQNLFIDDSGQWTARYIPAFLRRYPFVPAMAQDNNDDQMTVCIDEAAQCVTKDLGENLFVDGKNSEFLDKAINFLQEYKTQTDASITLVKQLADARLLVEQKASFKFNDGKSIDLTGFYTVDTTKLSSLTPETTYNLFQSGALHIAYLHLASLENLDRITAMHAQRFAVPTKNNTDIPLDSLA
jgi:hypothetical protein